jgi:hypothetical protein
VIPFVAVPPAINVDDTFFSYPVSAATQWTWPIAAIVAYLVTGWIQE